MKIEDLRDDWRLNGQEEILMNAKLIAAFYVKHDHDHCVFCWQKFMPEYERAFRLNVDFVSRGYVTLDGCRWICEKCFDDFKEAFNWEIM